MSETNQPSAGAVKLLPCPFCGSDKITVEWEQCPKLVESDTTRRWFAECTQCSCQGPFCQKEPEVPVKWNQRAHVAPLVEALEKIRSGMNGVLDCEDIARAALQQWKDGKG